MREFDALTLSDVYHIFSFKLLPFALWVNCMEIHRIGALSLSIRFINYLGAKIRQLNATVM